MRMWIRMGFFNRVKRVEETGDCKEKGEKKAE